MVIISRRRCDYPRREAQFDLARWLSSRSADTVEIAAITIAELWHGVERATEPHRARRESYVRGIASALRIVPYTEQTACIHARIWAELEMAGTMIGYYDLIVAATALEHDAEVATFNRRHFSCVPGLKIVMPQVSHRA